MAWPAQAQSVTENVIGEDISTEHETFRIVQIVERLEHPWAVNFLPDDRMLITERPARMHLVDGDQITELEGLPQVDAEEDLLHEHIGRIRDVRQGPDGYIYLATDEGDGGIFRLEPAQ